MTAGDLSYVQSWAMSSGPVNYSRYTLCGIDAFCCSKMDKRGRDRGSISFAQALRAAYEWILSLIEAEETVRLA
jgi:hypothetical protein